MRKFFFQLRGVKRTENSFCVILGFGDSDASLQIAHFFAKNGYNLILINNNYMLQSRKNQIEEFK